MPFTDDERIYILGIHEQRKSYKIIMELFKRRFGYFPSKSGIYNILKAENKTGSHGGVRRGLSKQKIIELHKACGGDMNLMRKRADYNYKEGILEKICGMYGLPIK